MNDEVLGKLREARALVADEMDSGNRSKLMKYTFQSIYQAVLWREEHVRLQREPINESPE